MDIREQFRKASDDAVKRARELAGSSKKAVAKLRCRRLIAESENALQTVYSEIGMQYYTERKEDTPEAYAKLFERVTDLLAQIDELKAELVGLDHQTICPVCGNTVDDNQKFCPECGAKNEAYGKWQAQKEAPAETEETPVEEAPEEAPCEGAPEEAPCEGAPRDNSEETAGEADV